MFGSWGTDAGEVARLATLFARVTVGSDETTGSIMTYRKKIKLTLISFLDGYFFEYFRNMWLSSLGTIRFLGFVGFVMTKSD